MPTKRSRKPRKKKKSHIIMLVPEGLGLSQAQIGELTHALKAKAETMISAATGSIVVVTDDIDFSG